MDKQLGIDNRTVQCNKFVVSAVLDMLLAQIPNLE